MLNETIFSPYLSYLREFQKPHLWCWSITLLSQCIFQHLFLIPKTDFTIFRNVTGCISYGMRTAYCRKSIEGFCCNLTGKLLSDTLLKKSGGCSDKKTEKRCEICSKWLWIKWYKSLVFQNVVFILLWWNF